MLKLAIVFFVLAVVAAILGFGGIAGTLAGAAEIAFWAFIVLFAVSLIGNVVRPRTV